MCMSIEYNLYVLHCFYYENDYNLFIICVFVFIMLSPNHHAYNNIICCIIQYIQPHNCRSIIFVIVSYRKLVSQ